MSEIAFSKLYKLTEQVSSHQKQLRSECTLILPAVNTDNGKKRSKYDAIKCLQMDEQNNYGHSFEIWVCFYI